MGAGAALEGTECGGKAELRAASAAKGPTPGESGEVPAHLSGTRLSGSHSVGELHALKSRVPLRKL